MAGPRRHRWWCAPSAALLMVMTAGACEGGAPARATRPARAQEGPAVAYDGAVTDAARVLAGLEPVDGSRFEAITQRPAWRAHRADFDKNWSRLETERFTVMRAWRDREFKPLAASCDTLFYPFGGPDILNAYVLYPDCNRYLLLGLEPVGSVPVLDRLKDAAADEVLTQVRKSLSDIFLRDYFITKEMMNELQSSGVDGTLPLLLVFLARLDARVVDIRMESPWAATGAVVPAGQTGKPGPSGSQARRPTAVTIRFTATGATRIQTLSYIRAQLEDSAMSKQAGMLAYLDRVAPFTTLVKSASYLMHDDRFSRVRSVILTRSGSVLQDDTGVPYRYFDKASWDLTLFGRYAPPIKDFNYGRQPDLEAAYRDPSAVHDLPFSFGYHWREGTSGVMLAVRRAASR